MRKRKYFTPQLKTFSARDFDDPQYIEWRDFVRKRDEWKCQMPNCGKSGKHCHHIQKWAHFPALRFDKNNGIYLCADCHKQIKGQEETYASLFMQIVMRNSVVYAEKLKKKRKR